MPPLPFLTADLPGIGGTLKHVPEDFAVEEIPAYEPSGAGEHLFLWIEKRDVAAEQLTRHLAEALNIPASEIGVAGLKDRRAVTRQYVSVPARCADRIAAIDTDQIHVLRSALHGNKLKTNHLRGNRFSILVRDVAAGAATTARAICDRLAAVGFPNYFGTQRFGHEGTTLALGYALLRGEKKPGELPRNRRRFLLRMAVSAVQSDLFNRVLAERLQDGLCGTVLAGDVMLVVDTGGRFVSTEPDADQPRLDSGEIALTGPLFGPKMKVPAGVPAEREARVLSAAGLTLDNFARMSKVAPGTRRPLMIRPRDLTVVEEADGVWFTFTLPAGVYATSLLREVQKSDWQAGVW